LNEEHHLLAPTVGFENVRRLAFVTWMFFICNQLMKDYQWDLRKVLKQ